MSIENHTFQTTLFLIAALTCLYAGHASMHAAQGRSRGLTAQASFWFVLGMALLFLGVAKLVGLQHFLGSQVRDLAREDGLYDVRRPYQQLANYAVVGIAVLTFASGVVIWVKKWFVLILPLGAMVLLLAFTAIRAISLHQVDTLLYRTDLWGVHVGTLVEVTITSSIAGIAFLIGLFNHAMQREPH
jgi:hypothetical protein